MSYDDFYYEPSESELYIEELKDKLKSEVKKDIINELNKLRKENEELKNIKNNISKLENKYKEKEYQLEREYKEKERTLMQKPLNELVKIIKEQYFYVTRPWKYIKKCDKCNDNRNLELVDPYGRKHEIACVCKQHEYKAFEVQEKYIGVITEISKRNNELMMWVDFSYSKGLSRDDYYISGTYFDKNKLINKYEELINKISKNNIEEIINQRKYNDYLFVNKNDAEKFAKFLNENLNKIEKSDK